MHNKKELSLKSYNTFGIDVKAKSLVLLKDPKELSNIENLQDCMFLGGGSNVLFTNDLSKTVIVNQTKGIDTLHQDNDYIELEIASGEEWHSLVLHCVNLGYGGIENMSLIPGSVGAAPMQNIGAYGAEIRNVLTFVKAIHLDTLEEHKFTNEECQFGYRESIFKKEAKGKYFIKSIGLKLSKRNYQVNTSYGDITAILEKKNIEHPSIKDVSDAVIEIRQSKLPDPKELGNAGSFFKNPVILKTHFDTLKAKFPEIKSYPIDDDHVKVPAGWLIESLGWKGKRIGNTGSHKKQALVLVNYGNVQGGEVKKLSEDIKQSVWDTYHIKLETEVNII
ncbi:MAG: UDP-N-acetylmuramate dehydrogenase [Bacteroidia bacterium]|nr:UDP-N-acetylmuramate dehydrogenase [Bacteroidia bacterium]